MDVTASTNIRVLVAAGSELVRRQLEAVLAADPDVRVAGSVADGAAALNFLRTQAADVALLLFGVACYAWLALRVFTAGLRRYSGGSRFGVFG